MREEHNQPISLAELRASLYSTLVLGFSAPNEGILEELSDGLHEVLNQEDSLPAIPALIDGIKNLEASINSSDKTSLMEEYHRLFVGPYSLLVPPYESIYREIPRTVMGESTLEVIKRYQEAGFLLSPSFKDLPDHIAAELEFMALLCERERRAWRRRDLSQAAKLLSLEETFLRDHLLRWIPNFTSKILASTEFPFYRALASLVKDYVLLDLDCVCALRRLLDAEGSATPMKGETVYGS